MSDTSYTNSDRAHNLNEILEFYRQQAENHEDLKTGVEWERFGVYTENQDVVPYLGDKGYLAILKYLHKKKGWEIEDSLDDNIYTLLRGKSRTTVEGDGKPEISASPHKSLHDVWDEIEDHKNEIEEISSKFGITWIPLGLQPFHSHDEIPLVPKPRYELWNRIFNDHHDWMHTYMKALSGIHLNFGYTSEENLIRKVQALYKVSPIIAAMFTNSPFENGKVAPCLGMRRHKLFTNGPGQEQMMHGMLDPDFSLQKWTEWYIDLPLIIFPFDQDIVVPKGWTFRTWMENGWEGRFPTFSDFDQHLKTRWTDIRFRPSYLEFRVFDTLPFPLLMAATAFVKGIVFDRKGWYAMEGITKYWTEEDIIDMHKRGCEKCLNTEIHGRTFQDIALELLEISRSNLQGFARMNKNGQDESIYLDPLERMLKRGVSPAEDLLEFTGGDASKILDWVNRDF